MDNDAKEVWIDLRTNNAITNDPCALCGSRCDPCGVDFFLRDSQALVCVPCARKHSPQLIEALHEAAANAPLMSERADSQEFDDHFGGCPLCMGSGVNRNIGREHYFCCDLHKVYWHVGSNLFSAWRGEPESLWESNRVLIETYTRVDDEVSQIVSAIARARLKIKGNNEVEVEHILHQSDCAIRHHTVGVPCDCGAAGWFEIMPRQEYEATLPKSADIPSDALDGLDDLPF